MSYKFGSLIRLLKINFQTKNIIITEYQKSGGTWLGNMLSRYFNLDFPRNIYPSFGPCIMHGHYLYSSLMNNVFVLHRDGRDVMVSFYFHSFFKNELYNHQLVDRMRRKLPFSDFNAIEYNLPKFIEFEFSKKQLFRFTWSEFVNSWYDKDTAVIKYENLLTNPVNELCQAIKKVTGDKPDFMRLESIVDEFSFQNVSKRKPGQESRKSFLRKGIAGDWKNYFTKESREIFAYHAGFELIKLGYEKDNSWV